VQASDQRRRSKARNRRRAAAGRVFRDDASLSANPDLWRSIQQALDDSDYFIPGQRYRTTCPGLP
jgi:hypothetical protein